MKIEYLGHSCFKLTESTGTSVLCDPFDAGIGYKMPRAEADAVTVSHRHYDHANISAVGGNPRIISGDCNFNGVKVSAVQTYHDDAGGKLRGGNTIFKFRMDGIDVCHMGDIGEPCSAELIERLLPVNVLLIPVGGTYTVDAEGAKEYVDRIMPDIVIPMHYKCKGNKMDIDRVEQFTDLFDKDIVEETETSEISLDRADFTGGTRVIVLERLEDNE